jgi:hypothetical protein
MLKRLLLGSVMLAFVANAALGQQREVKIGFVTTFNGGVKSRSGSPVFLGSAPNRSARRL